MKNDNILQARVDDAIIKQLNDIVKTLCVRNRSEAIRRSIEITRLISKSVKQGDRLIIERKNGDKIELLIPWV